MFTMFTNSLATKFQFGDDSPALREGAGFDEKSLWGYGESKAVVILPTEHPITLTRDDLQQLLRAMDIATE